MAAPTGNTTGAEQVARIRRNPWVMGLAATPFLICLLAIVGAIAINPGLLVGIIHGLIFGGVTTWYAWARNPWPRFLAQDMRTDDEWLHLGEERIARADIKSGIIIPAKGHCVVQLQRRGLRPAVELRVANEEEGQALLSRLGLAATQTVGRFRGMSRAHTSVWRTTATVLGTLISGGLVMGGMGALVGTAGVIPTMFVVMLVLMTLLLAPTGIEVGADGVLIRWLGRKRFIGHDDIDGVSTKVTGFGNNRRSTVQLRLSSGETVVLPIGPAQFDHGRSQGIAGRIRAAHDAYQRGESVHAEALLRRGDRTHVDWVRALWAPDAHASLRSAPVPRDRLWRIVEDVTVEPLDRAVAAVSLGQHLSADERGRLGQTAEATAAPRLRIALDAVAHGQDEEALGEALEELETEAAEAVQRQAQA